MKIGESHTPMNTEPTKPPSAYLAEIGRRGGQAKSDAKAKAARENSKKGGWPKGRKRTPKGTQ